MKSTFAFREQHGPGLSRQSSGTRPPHAGGAKISPWRAYQLWRALLQRVCLWHSSQGKPQPFGAQGGGAGGLEGGTGQGGGGGGDGLRGPDSISTGELTPQNRFPITGPAVDRRASPVSCWLSGELSGFCVCQVGGQSANQYASGL